MTPWTVAHQASLSMEFPRQECWRGLPFPLPGDLPDPKIEPGSPVFPSKPSRKPCFLLLGSPSPDTRRWVCVPCSAPSPYLPPRGQGVHAPFTPPQRGPDPRPPSKWSPNSSGRKAMETSSNSKEEALERAPGCVHSIKTASEKSLYCRQKNIISELFPRPITAK